MLAAAKINLMLHITGKRADGYHLLQSLVMFAAIGDEVTLQPSEDFSLQVRGEFAGALQGDNLVTRAAQALADAAGITPHGALTLEKHLPVGAGLGGGSADAAAALLLLAKEWKTNIPLAPIAATLGSDVPACMEMTPLWMEETGHRITPLAVPFDVPVLLVNPGVEVSTQAVYQQFLPPYAEPITLPGQFPTLESLVSFLQRTHNMLEKPATRLAPAIRTALYDMTMLQGCLLARMSGSGATCFGVFATEEACIAAANTLSGLHPNWWIRATRLTGNHGQEK
ncbi:MAG: 4-(cytidine 5'-diphospho)-2-C-methyl-D-erythritol kinase [Alphaproteobacteria bacterium]|nr:4-(cytidine 5'-diphospho)-2-C-methyl-D-erythritol kinase [Alphaproteobacteria bacterium]